MSAHKNVLLAPVKSALGAVLEPIFSNTYRVTLFLLLFGGLLALSGMLFELAEMHVIAGIFGALAISFAFQGVLAAPVIWAFHHLGKNI